MNGEGYLTAQEAFPQPDDFDVVYTKMSGEKKVLGDVVSACAPQMAFVSEAEFLSIHAEFERRKIAFRWQTGDVMLIENRLTGHGRNPFTGPRDVQVMLFQ